MCEIIPRSKDSSEDYYIAEEFIFDAEKVYLFDECDKEKVTEIYFFCNMPTIPKIVNFHKFPNLKSLYIWESKLQTIKRSDLVGLEKIECLRITHNKLEYLPGDLLEDMKNLKKVSFYGNHIRYIDKELIQSLKKLDSFDFKANVNIDRRYDKSDPYSCSFEEIEKVILEKCKVTEEFRAKIKQQLENQTKNIGKPGDLFSDFKNSLKNERTKDFIVMIENHKFKVHKFLLMARSPFLSEMIENNPDAVMLQLQDIPINIFEIILKFMYEDVLPPVDANFKNIFIAAGRLKIDLLKKYAAEKMIEQVDEENAFEFAILANKYEHDGLRREAFSHIRKMFPDKELNETLAKDSEKLQKLRKVKRSFDEAFSELQN